MKLNKSTWLAFALLIVVGAFSRLISYNIAGFAPQMAMALFGGAVIKNKKWAFALPLLSLLFSDALLELLFQTNLVVRAGFYEGQWQIYLCFALVTLFGFLLRNINWKNVLVFSISGSLLFFITSNFFVWIGGGGFGRPITFNGMLQCYYDGLAFYRDYGLIKGFIANFILGDLIWSAVLFGGYYLILKFSTSSSQHKLA
jgi:hypothetical protein